MKIKTKYKNILNKYLKWTEDSNDYLLPLLVKQEFYNLLLERGDDPHKIFKGVNNNYKIWFPYYSSILNNIRINIDSFLMT